MAMLKLIAANWKMNGRRAQAAALIKAVNTGLSNPRAEVVVCPPFPLLGLAADSVKGTKIGLGAQDCSFRPDGAYTGDVSAAMLHDMGCDYVILGHSERREYHTERDTLVAAKVTAAHKAGLKVILCVGEKDADLPADVCVANVGIQLRNSLPASAHVTNTVIAYEPVWAIGSGKTPTSQQITSMHKAIQANLPAAMKGARILYGGSVKADNAAAILSLDGVDGALVGGASLDAGSFLKIIAGA